MWSANWFPLDDPEDEIRRLIAESPYERIVVCRDWLDHVAGILRTSDLLKPALTGGPLKTEAVLRAPPVCAGQRHDDRLLESFRKARMQFALIVDAYGDLEGLVTLTDVLTSIVGELPSYDSSDEQDVVEREDGSWLVDGSVTIERLKSVLEFDDDLPGEEENAFNTLGGFGMHMLGHIPAWPIISNGRTGVSKWRTWTGTGWTRC